MQILSGLRSFDLHIVGVIFRIDNQGFPRVSARQQNICLHGKELEVVAIGDRPLDLRRICFELRIFSLIVVKDEFLI